MPEARILDFLISFIQGDETTKIKTLKSEAESILGQFLERRSGTLEIEKISEIETNPLNAPVFYDYVNILTIILILISGDIKAVNIFSQKEDESFINNPLKSELSIKWERNNENEINQLPKKVKIGL